MPFEKPSNLPSSPCQRGESDELVKSRRNDGFVCRGVRPDAHDRASAARPYMQGAQKLRSEAHLQVRRNDEVEAQRRRWTFYETIKSGISFRGHSEELSSL